MEGGETGRAAAGRATELEPLGPRSQSPTVLEGAEVTSPPLPMALEETRPLTLVLQPVEPGRVGSRLSNPLLCCVCLGVHAITKGAECYCARLGLHGRTCTALGVLRFSAHTVPIPFGRGCPAISLLSFTEPDQHSLGQSARILFVP